MLNGKRSDKTASTCVCTKLLFMRINRVGEGQE